MPRPRKFTDEELLDKAMELFWQHGYSNTSLKNLEKTLNLTAPSIYHAYGSKESLFLRAIDHYLYRVVDVRIATYLNGESPPLDNIRMFFLSVVENLDSTDMRLGCLLTNTATELGASIPPIAKKIQRGINKIKEAIYSALEKAQQDNQLSANRNIEELTAALLMGYQGLLVVSRLNYPVLTLKQSALSTLKILEE